MISNKNEKKIGLRGGETMSKGLKTTSAFMIMLAFCFQMMGYMPHKAYAAVGTQVVNGGTVSGSTVSGSAADVEFIGRIDSTIISVIMPTKVKFAVIPEMEGWDKMLSPDFYVRNVGNVKVDVSITKAEVVTPNVEFTSGEPVLKGDMRQIRMAVAPKEDYPSMVRVRDYILLNTVSDVNSIDLTYGLDYDPLNDTATYNVYGDVSTGWEVGEEFSVHTVFKVSVR